MSEYDASDTYRVYLREDSPSPALESPVIADRIDYYDSGIWLHLETGRAFLPYHRVEVITQGLPASGDEPTAAEADDAAAAGEEPDIPVEDRDQPSEEEALPADEQDTTVEEPSEPTDEP